MSDGGGETRDTSRKILGGDGFAFAIAKIAVAQVCDAVGFQGVHQSALDTLSDVVVTYIHQAGKNASYYANLSGRIESNASDIIHGLEDVGLPQGFSGASDTGHCLAGSGVIRGISRYVNEEGENPFVYEIPSFPVVRDRNNAPSSAPVGDSPRDGHIPHWLPAFPESQTYSREGSLDNPTSTIEPFRERNDVENSVVDNMHQHMSCNGFEAPIAVDLGDAGKAKQVVQNNPFLAPPLRFGEKEVSSVVIPPNLLDGSAMRDIENYVPGFEVLSPVDEPMKIPLKVTEEVKEKVSPCKRPTVQFKLKAFKKSSGTSWGIKIDDSKHMYSLFEINNDKHEGKGKAEQIMDSMDIVEESAEL